MHNDHDSLRINNATSMATIGSSMTIPVNLINIRPIATPKEVVTKHTLDPTTGKLRASHLYDINRKPPEGFMPGDK